jgi:L-malate glycosyltransferase
MSLGSPAAVPERRKLASDVRLPRTKTIEVCHVASGDLWAGAEAQIAALMKAMARRNGVSLSAILLNEGQLAEELRNSGIDVTVIPEVEIGFWGILRKATALLRNRRIDVLHSHRYKENLLAIGLSRRLHVPVVVRTQHGMPEPLRGFKRYKARMLESLDWFTARHFTDRVIAVSSEMRDRLFRYLPASRIETIRYGLDLDRVKSDIERGEAKTRLGITREAPTIGIAARLEPIKRLDIFVDAAREIAASLPTTRFVIAGSGREEMRLRKLVQSYGIAHQTLFLGYRKDIYDVERAMDIFVLCSDHEGFPMALLEALSLGVPVVARNVGGIPEVIQDGLTGMLVDSANGKSLAQACLKLLGDNGLRERLSQAGAHWVREKFNASRTAEEVANLYGELLTNV